jgi:hypothetical protein
MPKFEIECDGAFIGPFETSSPSVLFPSSEYKKGTYINLVRAEKDRTIIGLSAMPEEISIDRDGSIWLGYCRCFNNRVLWPLNTKEE